MNARYSINSGFPDRLRTYILKKHGSINAFCRAAGIKYPAQMTPDPGNAFFQIGGDEFSYGGIIGKQQECS